MRTAVHQNSSEYLRLGSKGMKATKAKALMPRDFFAALIRTAYFPQELPPAITTRYFADFCRTNYPGLKAIKNTLLKRTTNFETFTVPRLNNSRRNLAMVHPISQTALSLLVTEHRKAIKELIAKSGTSLYDTQETFQNREHLLAWIFENGKSDALASARNFRLSFRLISRVFSIQCTLTQSRGR